MTIPLLRLRFAAAASRGFTLIEAVMVIVITGIIAAIVAVFIRKPVEGYFDTVRRAELTDAADTALRRLAREVRLALPNSLRVDTSNPTYNYIEFILTASGGRYRDPSDGSTGGDFLSFDSTTDLTFDVVGPMPANPAVTAGDFIVVYNLGPGYDPANAYLRGQPTCDATPAAPGCNIAAVSAVKGNSITLDANPFAYQSPPLPSASNRFHVVPSAVKAVTYECPKLTAGDVKRYWNYGFNASVSTPPSAGSSAVAISNATCEVSYSQNVSYRNSLLYVKLTVSDAASGESITVFQQIHVDNSP